jgi:acyl transferase domain-containing protein
MCLWMMDLEPQSAAADGFLSMVIKTGCSASLVALHEACRALQKGDCESALVAGTSLIMGPYIYIRC